MRFGSRQPIAADRSGKGWRRDRRPSDCGPWVALLHIVVHIALSPVIDSSRSLDSAGDAPEVECLDLVTLTHEVGFHAGILAVEDQEAIARKHGQARGRECET